ncbi:MAG: hemolysin-like protein [Rhodospirillaceae bacterium]|nr:hemolysin-like protein [Rhodospirillaceae bacterium]|tara:strand:+ start:29447 stop:30268 length:822 start_codon:yes stop_codon:yes gene_type:complete
MDTLATDFESFAPVSAGNLTVRLADSPEEIAAAQSLRYRVFYDEMRAIPSPEMKALRLDFDSFDEVCDHLLVFCKDRTDLPCGVVGTYRILRHSIAKRNQGFYSANEFDLKPLLEVDGEIMELGRSCVDLEYRNRPTMQLLWQAIAAYVQHYKIEILFGCASLAGTEPEELKLPLSYLYHFHLAPEEIRTRAIENRYVDLNWIDKEEIEFRPAWKTLPPLIKGYIRLGGFVGDGAVVDSQFNTTDVSIIVKTKLITEKYFRHYERSADWSSDR